MNRLTLVLAMLVVLSGCSNDNGRYQMSGVFRIDTVTGHVDMCIVALEEVICGWEELNAYQGEETE